MRNVLILSVGGSPEPLITCINETKPDIVYFVHSKETLKSTETIINTINSNEIEYKFKEIVTPESLKESFDKCCEVLLELNNPNYNIHIDFTGGTKPMVAGLVLASINNECEYTYVGSKSIDGRDKEGVGIVMDGFESIKIQENPYQLYAIKEFENGKNFFNFYQFEAAYQNFTEAKSKSNQENLQKQAEYYSKLVQFYDAWDKFNNKFEKIILPKYFENQLLKDLDDVQLSDEFKNQLKNNYEFLKLKISIKNRNIKENINYYLPDLLNNAYRRIEERKYDDAVARLYRAIELIAQINLNDLGLIDEDRLRINSVFLINRETFDIKSREISFDILDEVESWHNPDYNNFKSTFKLASNKSYHLLSLFGVEYANSYLNDKNLKSLVNLRNESILAHGIQALNEDKAIELYDKVLNYAKQYSEDIEKYMKMAKFPKFEV